MRNQIIIVANLDSDPVIGKTKKGFSYCTLSVATRGSDGTKPSAFTVRVFGKAAEQCFKYLTTGSRIYAEGDIDGSTIIASEVKFLSNLKTEVVSAQV